MNPYVRCVHGSGVPEIRSLKELLSLKTQPDPAEPDTPCLRPSHGPESTWQGRAGEHADASAGASPALGGPAGEQHNGNALSPVLAFTADSVATPNTFATVVTHEQRIISHLTRRLRNSVRRHQDMPCGEPMEMVLSEGDATDEEDGDDAAVVAAAAAASAAQTEAGEASVSADDDHSADADVSEGPMLPSSTRDMAAEAEAEAAGAAAGRSPARPCSPALVEQQQQQWLMQANNERIVSPHSSSGMLCEFPAARAGARHPNPQRRPPSHPSSATNLPSLAAPTSAQAGGHPAAALRSYPAPVARLEESPYHYIMRNYIGGTFLYYSTAESKDYFLRLCHRVVAQVRPLLEQETLSPHHGLFPRLNAPAYVFGDIHGNFEDLSFFLKRLLIFHDFNLTPANILCLGDYVDRGPFSLECVMLLFSLKIMNASKIVMLRGNHEDRVVCGDLQTYGRGCFLGQCQTVFGYTEGMRLFKEVTALFKYLPLAAELVIPSTPNIAFLRSQQTAMHPNLYVSQPAVLLHDAAPSDSRTSITTTNSSDAGSRPHQQQQLQQQHHDPQSQTSGDVDSGEDVLSRSTTTLAPTAIIDGPSATPAATAGYSTIADASLARGQPSRHEAHEERILCTHGGIPRFDRPPLEENALNSLRTLAFPRMLTLFPNNPMVKDDPECAPDYFVRHELQTLWRRYPSTAPPEFTTASRREVAEARQQQQLQRGMVRSASEEEKGANDSVVEGIERGPSGFLSSSSEAASAAALVHGIAHRSNGPLQQQKERRLLPRNSSRDFLPLTSDEDVRKAWYTMFDLLWSDPTPMEIEEANATLATAALSSRMHINEWGFGINTRGSNVVSFSAKAVDTFLTAHHYSMLFRAHQEKAHGLRWSKSNKVLTIFSSSNYMGHRNGAGCVVVAANGEVQMVEKVCL